MKITKMYRYERDGGGITVSTTEPDKPYTILYLLVADEGKMLTDGKNIKPYTDTETPHLWDEIDAPNDKEEDA